MTTFDQILPGAVEVLKAHRQSIAHLGWLAINRDLNGRVRLIAPEEAERNEATRQTLETLYRALAERIAPHAYPVASGILFEANREAVCMGTSHFEMEGLNHIWVIDRLATEGNWAKIAPESPGAPRVVFFSIKGGVGRSTALAAIAWSLAQQDRTVLVIDIDLESPGLSNAVLTPDRLPPFGVTDWLVEDLVDNGETVLPDLYAEAGFNTPAPLFVVPAHGANPGEYIAKLGRVWMPKIGKAGAHEPWSARLCRLLDALENTLRPDVILIDSRAGIDEVASACVTDLGAAAVLLFAIAGRQTWSGYRVLFDHWQRWGSVHDIRQRLQLVAGLVPDDAGRAAYLEQLREDAWELFSAIYDEVGPDDSEGWNFAPENETAPHYPLAIRWNRGWFGLPSLHQRRGDADDVRAVFGPLLDHIERLLVRETMA
ncbi:hypothetical protein TDMWS_02690 [Thermodesulfomicrobium sp. WS]|uniref:KGGVGR-motif variant AAA ATPase n=1 Tax=Thermodesulfomicrobium sp. WS TaxID=3004129 RepID=UPI0024927F65|nr:ArsA-related P-loop ATPase [Thermodesulfomicrobium sp. WS]BDV00184.1 hypothetical protein TDMWS_02690 [Thermodesulfomicrobium sp. WS]